MRVPYEPAEDGLDVAVVAIDNPISEACPLSCVEECVNTEWFKVEPMTVARTRRWSATVLDDSRCKWCSLLLSLLQRCDTPTPMREIRWSIIFLSVTQRAHIHPCVCACVCLGVACYAATKKACVCNNKRTLLVHTHAPDGAVPERQGHRCFCARGRFKGMK